MIARTSARYRPLFTTQREKRRSLFITRRDRDCRGARVMSERLGSLPSDKKKEFTPAWGFNAAAERNYGESHTCNTARAGDLSSHNAFGEVEGAGRVEGAASFEGAGEGSLPETWKEYQEPVDRRTWNKRAHDKTGLSAKQKLQCLAAPAGKHDSLAGGLVAPRNFEVIEPVVEAVSYVVPEDVRLVVASAVAHTPGAAHHVSLVVDNLEESGGEGAAAFPPPTRARSGWRAHSRTCSRGTWRGCASRRRSRRR